MRLARVATETGTKSPPTATTCSPAETKPNPPGTPDRAEEDPGYFLIGNGRPQLERLLGFRTPMRLRLLRALRAHALAPYLGAIAVITGVQVCGLLLVTASAGVNPINLLLLGLFGLVPASEIGVSLVNRLVAALVPPRTLPKLELEQGVPPELRTLVAVPTLLTNLSDLDEQLERLEVHYLANPEGHLHFALLTDWPDAPCEQMPGDDELVAALADGIERLNARHEAPPGAERRFLLLHRRRLWNESDGRWIGWERKRGKLHELNRLLRGATDTSFASINGLPPSRPDGVRYVITLDADTRLPKGAAYRLVGAMAHPLNRPSFDPDKERVVEGYAVMQPRITPSMPTGDLSTLLPTDRLGPGGVDPYAAAASDVYQDLFEEGSYTGKGSTTSIPSRRRSREGSRRTRSSATTSSRARSRAPGCLTDVDLFEEFPSNYEVAARRQHRWARGDWQLLPWILGHAR